MSAREKCGSVRIAWRALIASQEDNVELGVMRREYKLSDLKSGPVRVRETLGSVYGMVLKGRQLLGT